MEAILQMLSELREDVRHLHESLDERIKPLEQDYWKRVGMTTFISAIVAILCSIGCEATARFIFKG